MLMKSRITLLILELPHSQYKPWDGHKSRFVVDDDGNFLSKYVTHKTIPETLQDLMYEYTNLDMRYFNPVLKDFVHEKNSNECEAIYSLNITRDTISLHRGYLCDANQVVNIEEKYERIIGTIPRAR